MDPSLDPEVMAKGARRRQEVRDPSLSLLAIAVGSHTWRWCCN